MSLSRRQLLGRLGIAGTSAVVGTSLVGCAGSGSDQANAPAASVSQGAADNPFSLDPDAPGEFVIPDQGYGTKWAKEQIAAFNKKYPHVKITMDALKDMKVQIQPRFIQGDPPDMVMPTGLDLNTLASGGQMRDASPLYTAPSWDDPGVAVEQTLLPGVKESGLLNKDQQVLLQYTYNPYGLWYSASTFDENGWAYPHTWDDLLALCAEIKSKGIAPMAYQGNYPSYVFSPWLVMIGKLGGDEVIKKIDNLEPNAWQQDAVTEVSRAWVEFRTKGYFLKGTEGLSHTESQTYWAQGKAALIPCGGWLENESASVIPDGFEPTIAPTPSLTSSDAMPFAAITATAGNNLFVPAKAKNPAFGLEFLRFMVSKEGAKIFTSNTKTLTVVKGGTEGLDLTSGLKSQEAVIKAAGTGLVNSQFGKWYPEPMTEIQSKLGLMFAGQLSASQFGDEAQRIADAVKSDDSVTKYHR